MIYLFFISRKWSSVMYMYITRQWSFMPGDEEPVCDHSCQFQPKCWHILLPHHKVRGFLILVIVIGILKIYWQKNLVSMIKYGFNWNGNTFACDKNNMEFLFFYHVMFNRCHFAPISELWYIMSQQKSILLCTIQILLYIVISCCREHFEST